MNRWMVVRAPGFNRNIYVGPAVAKMIAGRHVSTQTMESRAHLISAAPELLRAAILAKATLAIVALVGSEALSEIFFNDVKDFWKTRKEIELAIQKATGES